MRIRWFARPDVQQQHKTNSIRKSRLAVPCGSVLISLCSSMAFSYYQMASGIYFPFGCTICIYSPLTDQIHGKRRATTGPGWKDSRIANREMTRTVHRRVERRTFLRFNMASRGSARASSLALRDGDMAWND